MIATPLIITGIVMGIICAIHTDREDDDPVKPYAIIGTWFFVATSIFALFYGSIFEGWFQ